jgi:subtilisin family serine protease
MLRTLARAVLVVAVAGTGAVPASAADPGPLEPLCGIDVHVDDVLRCIQATSQAGPAQAGPVQALEVRPPAATSTRPQFDPERILVRFKRGTDERRAAAVLRRAGVQLERRLKALRLYAVRTAASRRDAALRELAASPAVAAAEKEVIVGLSATTPNDAVWPYQSGFRKIGLPEAWELTHGSPNIVVAVVDTGVSASQPDLAGAVLPGYDFANGDADASDDEGHGTSVAGVIAARGNNTQGVAGVCWLCRILPVKVLGADGFGTTSTVAAGVVWAADHGAAVINLSLGGPGTAAALDDAVAYARTKGAIVVAAAGNSGVTTPFFPAAVPGVLAVAGTDDTDRLHSWSNRGPWVAVAAPGCNPAPFLEGYGFFCGTSSAAPVVAGLAALGLARVPGGTRDSVQSAIERSAQAFGPDVRFGRINAPATLTLLKPLTPSTTTAAYRSTLAGRTSFWRTVATGELSATLRFGSSRLTLRLFDAHGRLIARAAGRSPLRLVRTLEAGSYRLEVSGPGRRASFSLGVTHASAGL